jgi:hypothetical protein
MSWCCICGHKQFTTEDGIDCENGHRDSGSLEDPKDDKITAVAFRWVLNNKRVGNSNQVIKEIPRCAGVIEARRIRLGTHFDKRIIKADESKDISVPQNVIWVIYERLNAEPGRQFLFKLLEGGVTGYESFYIDSYVYEDILKSIKNKEEDYWTAYAGTPGSWDRLVVPGVNKLIMDFLNDNDLYAEIHAGLR